VTLLNTTGRTSLTDQPTDSVVQKLIAQFNKLFTIEHLATGAHGLVSLQTLTLASLTPPTLKANTDNYTPTGLERASYLRIESTGAVNLTGLVAPVVVGRVLWVRNVGTQNITLTHEDVLSTPSARFQLPNAASVILGAGEGLQLLWDTRWGTVQQ
jgi:hypothetical protein